MGPLEVIERWQQLAWGEGDPNVVDELCAEGYTRHGHTGTEVRTAAQVKEDLRQYQRVMFKPTVTVHDRVLDGDKVWSRLTMRGVNLDTGAQRSVHSIQIHRVVDGRIAEVWSLYTDGDTWPESG